MSTEHKCRSRDNANVNDNEIMYYDTKLTIDEDIPEEDKIFREDSFKKLDNED
jgi:hypothetical protein